MFRDKAWIRLLVKNKIEIKGKENDYVCQCMKAENFVCTRSVAKCKPPGIGKSTCWNQCNLRHEKARYTCDRAAAPKL